jgi:hypothetical protein
MLAQHNLLFDPELQKKDHFAFGCGSRMDAVVGNAIKLCD